MSKDANVTAQKKMCEIVNSDEFEKLHEVFAPEVKDHDPEDDQSPGPEGFVHWFTHFHSAFPDFKIAVQHLVADEENVAFASTITDHRTAHSTASHQPERRSKSAACKYPNPTRQ